MLAHKQIVSVVFSLIAIQLTVANPLWTFDTLFVSEEEGLVKNIEYAQMQRSSEELLITDEEIIPKSTKSGDNSCSVVVGANLPPRAVENTFEIFAKVLVRDSREATKNKLRDLKAQTSDKETSISYIFIMLKTFQDVNVTREGESMYKALKEIVHKSNEDNVNLFEDTIWFDKIIDNILCLVLNANSEKNIIDDVVDNYSMLEAISAHFDLVRKFWLDYRATKRARLQQVVNDARAKHD